MIPELCEDQQILQDVQSSRNIIRGEYFRASCRELGFPVLRGVLLFSNVAVS